jgi:hypothetical protein
MISPIQSTLSERSRGEPSVHTQHKLLHIAREEGFDFEYFV